MLRSYGITKNGIRKFDSVGFNFYKEPTPEIVVDIDGNSYYTTIIGNQEWITKNLITSKYSDGTVIPVATSDVSWAANSTGICSSYNYSDTNKNIYGLLYSGYAVHNIKGLVYFKRDGVHETDWKIPTDSDFQELSDFYGGNEVSGQILRAGGFSAFLGGYRRNIYTPDCINLNLYGTFWTKDIDINNKPIFRSVMSQNTQFVSSVDEFTSGRSIRCLRNI